MKMSGYYASRSFLCVKVCCDAVLLKYPAAIVGKPGGRLCSDKKLSEMAWGFVISIIGKSGLSEKPECNLFSIRIYRKENRCDFEDTVNIR